MTIEKIKDALMVCSTQMDCYGCPYEISSGCKKQKDKDALNAIIELEEQITTIETNEKRLFPKPPKITTNSYGWKFFFCPTCGREFYGNRAYGFFNKSKYCDKCGQEIQWD